MARDLSKLRSLNAADEVIACLREDPLDRVLDIGNDLGPDDWNGAIATRSDDTVLVVRSLKAVGAASIADYVNVLREEGYPAGPHTGEIAVVGNCSVRTLYGWFVPPDIEQLMRDAEEGKPGRLLSWAGFEGLCVLSEHPAADRRDDRFY